VRTETDELEYVVVRFSANQDQVGLDVTIPVVLPIPTERMIMVLVGQNLIMGQGRDDGDEVTLQRLPVRSLGFALVVTLERPVCSIFRIQVRHQVLDGGERLQATTARLLHRFDSIDVRNQGLERQCLLVCDAGQLRTIKRI